MRTTLFTLGMLVCCTGAVAQGPMTPSQIASARTFFLASGSGPRDGKDSRNQAIAYTAIAEGLRKQGGLTQVASPHDADLALVESISYDFADESLPKLRLRIFDPNTNVLLWELDQPLRSAYFLDKRMRKQLDTAVTALFQDFGQLRHGTLPGSDTTVPANPKENQ